MPIVLVFLLLILIIILVLIFGYYYRSKKKLHLARDYQKSIPEDVSYEYVFKEQIKEKKNFNHSALKKIDAIYFVHGTFVGSDPFQIYAMLEKLLPVKDSVLYDKMKQASKNSHDFINKDFGNFSSKHIEFLRQNYNLPCQLYNFIWSSGNDHYSRVIGMLELVQTLANKQYTNNQILLIGHSHAGQVFALLSQLLNNKRFRSTILKQFHSQFKDINFLPLIKKLKGLKIDFVTMGAPARYQWNLNKNMRLLHFINHRRTDLRAYLQLFS